VKEDRCAYANVWFAVAILNGVVMATGATDTGCGFALRVTLIDPRCAKVF
jgi:hypothetical protein